VLLNVSRIFLRVPNAQAAAKFYSETMGLTVARSKPNAVAMGFPGGGAELVLHEDKQRPDVDIAFAVDDVRTLFAQRDALGLTFLTPPTPAGEGFRATLRDPFGNVMTVLDSGLSKPSNAAGNASSHAPGQLFDDDSISPDTNTNLHDREQLIGVYSLIARTADDLPYTPHYEQLYSLYVRKLPTPVKPTHNDVWRMLLTLRKAGKLPRLGPATSKPPAIEPADKQRLRDLLGPDIGKRDRLPYTPRFDAIVAEFNTSFARAYSPHVVWRILATLAK